MSIILIFHAWNDRVVAGLIDWFNIINTGRYNIKMRVGKALSIFRKFSVDLKKNERENENAIITEPNNLINVNKIFSALHIAFRECIIKFEYFFLYLNHRICCTISHDDIKTSFVRVTREIDWCVWNWINRIFMNFGGVNISHICTCLGMQRKTSLVTNEMIVKKSWWFI